MRQRQLGCETLETRDVPSTVETFETARFPFAPDGWQEWSSNNSQYYGVTRSAVLSGTQALGVFGSTNVESRLWKPQVVTADVSLTLAVRGDTPAPILLYGRGANLNSATASYQGVAIARGGSVELRDTKTVVASITPKLPVTSGWLRVTVSLQGTTANVKVQRVDTQQYLNANGDWQAAAVNAITKTIASKPAGSAGIGRLSGTYGTAYVDDFGASPIIVTPPPVSPPPVVSNGERKFDHIRIAQLAYSGSNITAVEKQLFKDTVDLVVANPSYLSTFETADAGTPKILYSNVSNIYEGLLSNWLDTADRTGVNRELAFYHVSQATPFSGSSSSAQPVAWFWSAVKNGSLNVNSLARGTTAGGISFAANDTLALGGLDRFRELNITISQPAGSAFNGVWEYASAVDANGNVTAWKSLPIISNGTNGLKTTGKITFDPPGDWARGRLNGDRQYFVRFRTTSATNSPVISKIHSRDYVNANGGNSGVIPAFDNLADSNNDGYLTDAEFALRRGGFDARFISESRLLYPNYGQMRFVVNPTFDSVKEWAGDYHADFLAKYPLADGLFLDNQNGRLPFSTPVKEVTANYTSDSAAMVAAIKDAIDDRTIVVNTSGALTGPAPDGVTREAGIAFEEFLLRPLSVNWSTVNDVAVMVNRRLAASPTTQVILDSHPGTTSMLDNRLRMGVLSYYYLLGNPDRTYLMVFGGNSPTSSWQNRWIPAAATDVGNPTAAMTTFASGNDPSNAQLQYKVLGRTYENALVLFKPLSYTLGKGTGTTGNNTATTHALNGQYRTLNADGTLGPVISSITLRNGEGAVLMKA